MPMAELFGQWAVAAAVAESGGWAERRAGFVFTDCAPAAAVMNAATSGNAAMRSLVMDARSVTQQWLAVAVPREANSDADRLSHPAQLGEVEASAREAGFRVKHATISPDHWARLRAACELARG